jgi:hypothetical protein
MAHAAIRLGRFLACALFLATAASPASAQPRPDLEGQS